MAHDLTGAHRIYTEICNSELIDDVAVTSLVDYFGERDEDTTSLFNLLSEECKTFKAMCAIMQINPPEFDGIITETYTDAQTAKLKLRLVIKP